MNIKQVLSIEQMQHLKELGVDTSKASAYWYRIIQNKGDGNIRVISDWKLTFSLDIAYCTEHTLESVRTSTLQDIFDLLPSTISVETTDEINEYWLEFGVSERDKSYWFVQYRSIEDSIYVIRENESLIDASYKMLCWCVENGYIKTSKEE